MGKTHSHPRSGREPLRTAHKITFPVYLTCTAQPTLGQSFHVAVPYNNDIVLYDVLKQIETEISCRQKAAQKPSLKISAVSRRSFLRHRIELNTNSSKENRSRLRALQYRSITSYSEKTIRREGVHCEMEIVQINEVQNDQNGTNSINSISNTERSTVISMSVDSQSDSHRDSERKPLRTLSNHNENDRNVQGLGPHQSQKQNVQKTGNPGNQKVISSNSMEAKQSSPGDAGCPGSRARNSGIVELRRRLKVLSVNEDSAYCHYDEILIDLEHRNNIRLEALEKGKKPFSPKLWGGLSWHMREVLLDWLFDLQGDLALHDETLFAAIHYLDIYMSRKAINRRDLQLLGVSCCMLASKTYEVIPQPMSEWLYLSHDQYSRKQMVAMEKQLLHIINWTVFQVTPCCYFLPWLQLIGLDENTGDIVQSKRLQPIPLQENIVNQGSVSKPKNNKVTKKQIACHRFLIDLATRCAAWTPEYLDIPSAQVAAAAIVLSFLYLRSDDENESAQSQLNRARGGAVTSIGPEWTTETKEEQQQWIEILAAASKVDLKGAQFGSVVAVIDKRICKMLKDADGDASVCALHKVFTDKKEIQKQYGHSMDIYSLCLTSRRRPFHL